MDFGHSGAFLIVGFLGSVLGGMSRFLLSGVVARRIGETFPFGTLLVNVTGAFAAGCVWALLRVLGDLAMVSLLSDFLLYGFLGGYTTVSSFTLNTLALIRDGENGRALANIFGSWLLCLGAAFLGAAFIPQPTPPL